MTLPDVTLQINDGALGILPGASPLVPCIIGTCTLGVTSTVYSFGDPTTAFNTLGYGPLTEAVCRSLGIAGGSVIAIPANPSVAGTSSAVTHSGTGTSVQTVTVATANDSYSIQFNIVAGAASLSALTATFQYSLDGGQTFSVLYAVPVSGLFVIPNTGLTVTWAAGTFVAGDTYAFTCTAPGYSTTDLATAITAALASPLTYGFIHAVGQIGANAAATAAAVAAIDTQMSTAQSAYRYIWTLIEIATDTDANILAAFLSVSSLRTSAWASTATVASAINGKLLNRSSGWCAAERAAAVNPGIDLGRVLDGSLKGVSAITRDERVTPGLDSARIGTLRTIIGKNGYWITQPRMLAPLGSDYYLIQYRRIMDVACAVVHQALAQFINDTVLVDPSTGYIDNRYASNIEAYANSALNNALSFNNPPDVAAATAVVNRAVNIISTGTIPVTVRITPNGYAKAITVNIGFVNPALKLASSS